MVRKISLSLLTIGLIALVVSGASFALFRDSTTNSNNTFATGTVKLGQPHVHLLNVENIAPGDSGTQSYAVEYQGTLDAWLGLNASLTGDLTTCDGGDRFQVAISDGTQTYSANASNQVIGSTPFQQGQQVDLVIDWMLDRDSGNDCQAKSAELSLQVNAVQSKNNTNAGGTGPIDW